MYTSVDFSNQIVVRRGFLVPQSKGSHKLIWCLAWDIKEVMCVIPNSHFSFF
jgi:hypothetical protein